MSRLPTVTALVAAYNYEQYVGRAVQSALDQEYPPELLDVVVVDDGSKDRTAEVVRELAERNPGRVTLIQQVNGGATAALNRARREARGELLGLLDADDVWLPQKTIRQVEMFLARPELSGNFCEMLVVDGEERVVGPKIGDEIPKVLAKLEALEHSQYAWLLWGNVATHSSVMVRAEAFDQVPAEIPYADWWTNLTAAKRSSIGFVTEPLALYRVHGANLTGGVSGAGLVREKLKEVYFRLHALRHLELDSLSPEDLAFVWDGGVERGARETYQAADTFYTRLFAVTPEDRERSAAHLAEAEQAAADGDHNAEAVALVKAMAWNPYLTGDRLRLEQAIRAAAAARSASDPLAGARELVVVADAEALLEDDSMLSAYA